MYSTYAFYIINDISLGFFLFRDALACIFTPKRALSIAAWPDGGAGGDLQRTSACASARIGFKNSRTHSHIHTHINTHSYMRHTAITYSTRMHHTMRFIISHAWYAKIDEVRGSNVLRIVSYHKESSANEQKNLLKYSPILTLHAAYVYIYYTTVWAHPCETGFAFVLHPSILIQIPTCVISFIQLYIYI